MSNVKFTSNKKAIVAKMKQANELSLTAMGMAGSAHVVQVIQSKNLIDSGALMNSIDYETNENSVYVGSKLTSEEYPLILEKNGNEYLHPGIMGNLSNLEKVFKTQYRNTMKG